MKEPVSNRQVPSFYVATAVVRLAHHCDCGGIVDRISPPWWLHHSGGLEIVRSAAGREKIRVWNEELNIFEFLFIPRNAYVAASRKSKAAASRVWDVARTTDTYHDSNNRDHGRMDGVMMREFQLWSHHSLVSLMSSFYFGLLYRNTNWYFQSTKHVVSDSWQISTSTSCFDRPRKLSHLLLAFGFEFPRKVEV